MEFLGEFALVAEIVISNIKKNEQVIFMLLVMVNFGNADTRECLPK